MNNKQPLRAIHHYDSFFNNHLIGGEEWGVDTLKSSIQ